MYKCNAQIFESSRALFTKYCIRIETLKTSNGELKTKI